MSLAFETHAATGILVQISVSLLLSLCVFVPISCIQQQHTDPNTHRYKPNMHAFALAVASDPQLKELHRFLQLICGPSRLLITSIISCQC